MALTPANAQRSARKNLLDELRLAPSKRDALDRCADLVVSAEPALDGLSVIDLVRQCRRLSRDGARVLLEHAEVDPSVRVGDMLARDALRLAAVLRSGR